MFSKASSRCVILLLLTAFAAAQTPPQIVRRWTSEHRQQILDQFTALLSIPNGATYTANISRNAEMLVGMLNQRGVDARLLSI